MKKKSNVNFIFNFNHFEIQLANFLLTPYFLEGYPLLLSAYHPPLCNLLLTTFIGLLDIGHSSNLFFQRALSTATYVCFRITFHLTVDLIRATDLPFIILFFWYFELILLLSSDVHPNPGPTTPRHQSGFLSFCNWNLNTLSKNNFQRVTLLEAHNSEFNYDIISLCETSLTDETPVPDDILPGYRYQPLNHPDGNRSGGVGIFYKDSLPLRVRLDLSFNECLVLELMFGRKKIFFFCFVPKSQRQSQLA